MVKALSFWGVVSWQTALYDEHGLPAQPPFRS
jgi:hypothetical protein